MHCQFTAHMSTPHIEVEMYLADESDTVDYQLTSDFYSFWRESGLPDFPFQVSYWIMYCATGDRALRVFPVLLKGLKAMANIRSRSPI